MKLNWKRQMNTGPLAIILVCVILLLALMSVLLIWLYIKKKRDDERNSEKRASLLDSSVPSESPKKQAISNRIKKVEQPQVDISEDIPESQKVESIWLDKEKEDKYDSKEEDNEDRNQPMESVLVHIAPSKSIPRKEETNIEDKDQSFKSVERASDIFESVFLDDQESDIYKTCNDVAEV